MLTIPNLLSLLRLGLVPILLGCAWFGASKLFLSLLLIAMLTDVLDGAIARHFHQTSALGAKLDSWADVSIYLMLPIAIWWLWPAIIMRELPFIMIIIFSLLLPGIVSWLKFRTITSYHTWLAKVAAITTLLATLLMLLDGPAWPFRAGSLLSAAAGLEQLMITLLLTQPQPDIRSLWHTLNKH